METMCNNCQIKGKWKRCSRCKKVFYCSVNCQKLDYGTHKKDCHSPNSGHLNQILQSPTEKYGIETQSKNTTDEEIDSVPKRSVRILQPLAEKYGMSEYWKSITDDIDYHEAKAKSKKQSSELFDALSNHIKILNNDEIILVKVGNNKERSHLHALARYFGLYSCGCNYQEFDTNYMYRCKMCNTIYADNELTWHNDYGFTTGSYMGCYAKCYHSGDDEEDAIYYYGDNYDDEDQDMHRFVGLNSILITKTINEAKLILSIPQNRKKYGYRKKKQYEIEKIDDIRNKVNSIHNWQIEIIELNEVNYKIECPKYKIELPKNN